ncbi:hypothetical protein NQ315_009256 [Exocentrus adspersus]|uniref:Spliceosome-associated protein CWC27 homolog n=1 Tax=Exocentrus adspersus TaxID=1586481 RepID=A0AAV8WFV1_9CUCU|nr:hypothetical protein NQ315_009256 [Exocentrus adspersus]
MSNVYILEPQTSGKVLLKTTVGDIDVEFWAKETPKTCRNFIQLCLEGYYDNTIFHRVVKEFIVQGGDPNGDGTGGESIYGEPFKDEFHQRLRFTRRGLLAMANSEKDDNGSQFFFTLGPTPELQNKHTLFGKVTGDTIFNMLKLGEGLVEDERPVYPHKILKTEVLNNPFPDIVPRLNHHVEVKEKKRKEKKPGVKNFKLLSFGEEAEEDEEQSTRENEKYMGKGKSTHDVLDDPKLSSQSELPTSDKSQDEVDPEEQLENIKKKLKTSHKKPKPAPPPTAKDEAKDDSDEDLEYYLHKDRDLENKKKMEEIKQEIQSLKKDYHKNKLKKDEIKTQEIKEEEIKSETFKAYKEEYDTYKSKKGLLPKKGSGREKFTLDLLEKFKQKLHSAKEKEPTNDEEKDDDIDNEEAWLSHKLRFQDDDPVLAKDANTKDDDWFEIYDPRNPLNKRRRGENTGKSKK